MGSGSLALGIVVGLGIGMALLSGCAPRATEANEPPAAAPIPLVPEAYTALSAPVAPTASPAARSRLSPLTAAAPAVADRVVPPGAAPTSLVSEDYTALSAPVAPTASPAARPRLSPPPAAALAVADRAVQPTAIKLDQYRPHWVVDLH